MKPSVKRIYHKLQILFIGKKYAVESSSSSALALKQALFVGMSFFAAILCGPLLVYGSHLFLRQGQAILAALEFSLYIIMLCFIFCKSLSIDIRNFVIILSLYAFSVVLLVATGNQGAGMVCVIAVLFLSGVMLSLKRLIILLGINLAIFSALTLLYLYGALSSFAISNYEGTWFINILTTQFSGIGLMFLVHIVYNTLNEQNKALEESEAQLIDSEKSKALLLANIRGMIYRCKYDREWTMEYISEGCYELTGYRPESLLGNNDLSYNDIISDEYKADVWSAWSLVLKENNVYHGEYQIVTANGEKKWVYEQGKGVYDQEGNVVALEGIIVDISERKSKEEHIMYLNQYDILTGLFNRRAFEEKKLFLFGDANLPVSVIAGDINGLKLINDTLGHDKGDLLIKEVAGIIKDCCRKQDFAARTGGDEFLIVLPNTANGQAEEMISEIQQKCEEKSKKIDQENFYMSLSLGYATKRKKSESVDGTIKTAENFMYKRKLLENRSVHNAILKSIQATMYERSFETEEHSRRLAHHSHKIGLKLNLPPGQLDEIALLAMLHDIGKIGVDDRVLKKPGPLTENEWIQMKRHPEIGYRIAISSPELAPIAEYILSHHERWDGSGYPRNLEGNDIPLQSRIISIVDAYDAMTSDRPYRSKIGRDKAIAEIKKGAGTQFDPHIAEVFLEILQERTS